MSQTSSSNTACLYSTLEQSGVFPTARNRLDAVTFTLDSTVNLVNPIIINGNSLKADERSGILFFGREINVVAIDAAQTDYILVQTSKKTLDDGNYNALDFLGIELLDMVSERTYLCRFKGKDLDQLRDLDFVTFVDTYKENFVVAASLKKEASTPRPLLASSGQAPNVSTGQAMVQVDVVLHSGSAADGGTIKREIARMTGVEPSTITIIDERLRAGLPYSSLTEIAQLDPVQAILPVHQVKVMNDIRREVFPS